MVPVERKRKRFLLFLQDDKNSRSSERKGAPGLGRTRPHEGERSRLPITGRHPSRVYSKTPVIAGVRDVSSKVP